MAHEDGLKLIVNLEPKTVSDRKVTFDEIVPLALLTRWAPSPARDELMCLADRR